MTIKLNYLNNSQFSIVTTKLADAEKVIYQMAKDKDILTFDMHVLKCNGKVVYDWQYIDEEQTVYLRTI